MLQTVGLVVAPVTLLTALLYYFGWIRSNSLWLYFGVDQSALGFSVQDYLLRSIGAIFVPLGGLLIVCLLLIEAHTEIAHWVEMRHHHSLLVLVARSVALVGLILFGIGVSGEARHPIFGIQSLVTPLAFALGAGAIGYGAYLARRLRSIRLGSSGSGAAKLGSVRIGLAGAFIILMLFWALGDWADAAGRGRALQLAQEIPQRPGVVVYSKERLNIEGHGVLVQEVGDQSAFRYRYTGLKLLIRSGTKYFLVPGDWSPSDAVTIVLPDSDSRLLEFTPR
jgi:hypothetical protein